MLIGRAAASPSGHRSPIVPAGDLRGAGDDVELVEATSRADRDAGQRFLGEVDGEHRLGTDPLGKAAPKEGVCGLTLCWSSLAEPHPGS